MPPKNALPRSGFPEIDPSLMQNTAQATRVQPRDISSGTMRGQQTLGGPRVKVNSSEGNIVVNDGTNDRILIGFQEDGF